VDDVVSPIFVGVILCLAGCGGCIQGNDMGFKYGVATERQKAVDAGVGRWVVDETTGATTFVYGPSGGGK
jgi:hypothetical protein